MSNGLGGLVVTQLVPDVKGPGLNSPVAEHIWDLMLRPLLWQAVLAVGCTIATNCDRIMQCKLTPVAWCVGCRLGVQ